MRVGCLFQRGGLWIGIHYSPFNKRYCVNLIPCFTIWFTMEGGKTPMQCKNSSDYRNIKA